MDTNVKKNLGEMEDLEISLKIINKTTLIQTLIKCTKHLILTGISIITFFPFLWMISSALKTKDEMFNFPPVLIPELPQWSNFVQVFKEAPFEIYLGNSLFVASIEVVFQVISAAMIAYALTQFKFIGKKVLFALIMATYMLPSAVTYVPCYMILAQINLIDTLTGLIISNLVNVFGIFLIRQAFLQVDRSLVEAARMDGASHLKILLKIMFPLTKPTFITFGLISFVTYYNEYMYPSLITKSPENFLVSAGLRQFFIQGGAYGIKWPEIMGASTITVLPLLILFFIAQKWFMQGVSDSGVKG
ncbi:L-arabinose transport system permease protein AraQ [Clostridium puniceum]|uniref:L-arabinose transport system permease protein AraQ n=1 Tax=Clostridium puniceum TaxID=29367 RepID=A0A1S8THT9_9CLOT|nr:carbohydrate ABC transporter permease [Clostridium puniceum]OOM77246.1 L-arabinose transport system permease protein AraQ [Clostridium puniceum]